MFCQDLISLLQSLNVDFTPMSVENSGKTRSRPFVIVCGTLPHIRNTFPIPDLMSTFKDLNDYQSQKKLSLNYLMRH